VGPMDRGTGGPGVSSGWRRPPSAPGTATCHPVLLTTGDSCSVGTFVGKAAGQRGCSGRCPMTDRRLDGNAADFQDGKLGPTWTGSELDATAAGRQGERPETCQER
jgi:hypothetical protein